MAKTFWIGIDIGTTNGAICIMDPNGRYGYTGTELKFVVLKMPVVGKELDLRKLYEILEPFEGGNGVVVFEKIGQIFGSSKATATSLGYQSGALEMACVGLSIPYETVPPKVWQKQMFLGITEQSKPSSTNKTQVRDTKAMALIKIRQMYPKLKLTFGDRAEKPNDGLIDSVLLACYAKKNYP